MGVAEAWVAAGYTLKAMAKVGAVNTAFDEHQAIVLRILKGLRPHLSIVELQLCHKGLRILPVISIKFPLVDTRPAWPSS